MTKQLQENAPMPAPAESRAAPPPVALDDSTVNERPMPVIAYSEPALRAVTGRPWGQASFGFAMFAVFCLMMIFTRNERLILVAGWIQLTAATLGVAAGVLALVRKSPWIALTVTGLTFNGCFLIGDIILALLNGMPIFI